METLVEAPKKRRLRTVISPLFSKLKFGDYFLFQEYSHSHNEGPSHFYDISRPTLAIYIAWHIADQTVEIEFIKWRNLNREEGTFANVGNHIEWYDYLDVLGHWHHKPTWREIIASYRGFNRASHITSEEIDW